MGRIDSKAALALAAALALGGCGGGGGAEEAAQVQAAQPSTFAAYAQRGSDAAPALSLDAAGQAEVARLSRDWAAGQLAAASADAFVLPALHFARVQAVAAAASGSTLAQLRAAVPAPGSAAVSAALVQGLARTLRAAADSTPADAFMADVTARGVGTTWQSLALQPLDAAALADQPNLRLSVRDALSLSLAWPQAQTFGGVFEDARGSRVLAQMVRVSGPLKSWQAAGADYQALSLSAERWLVRITPPAGADWAAADLSAAVAAAQAGVADGTLAPARGDLVLPLETAFSAVGTADLRGMNEAQSPTRADLRRLDGRGGTYAVLPDAQATLQFTSGWLALQGTQQVDFVFSARQPVQRRLGDHRADVPLGRQLRCHRPAAGGAGAGRPPWPGRTAGALCQQRRLALRELIPAPAFRRRSAPSPAGRPAANRPA